MIVLASYEQQRFNELPWLDEANSKARERGTETLAKLASIISDHDGDTRVGVALLHRHFPLARNEQLVERLSPDRRYSVSRPEPTGSGHVPHLFRVTREGREFRWVPLEFVDGAGADACVSNVCWLQETSLLDQLAQALGEDDALQLFGISVSHGRDEIVCRDDEVLVETTDWVARMLTMTPRPLREVEESSTPTNWEARGGEVMMRCTCQRAGDERHGHFETN